MKTAIEFLIDEIIKLTGVNIQMDELIIEQAKAMEKQQICNAWYNSLTKGDYNSADEYYNETFKSE